MRRVENELTSPANGAWCFPEPPEGYVDLPGGRDHAKCRGAVITHAHVCKQLTTQKVSAILLAEQLAWLSATFSERAGFIEANGDDYIAAASR